MLVVAFMVRWVFMQFYLACVCLRVGGWLWMCAVQKRLNRFTSSVDGSLHAGTIATSTRLTLRTFIMNGSVGGRCGSAAQN